MHRQNEQEPMEKEEATVGSKTEIQELAGKLTAEKLAIFIRYMKILVWMKDHSNPEAEAINAALTERLNSGALLPDVTETMEQLEALLEMPSEE